MSDGTVKFPEDGPDTVGVRFPLRPETWCTGTGHLHVMEVPFPLLKEDRRTGPVSGVLESNGPSELSDRRLSSGLVVVIPCPKSLCS